MTAVDDLQADCPALFARFEVKQIKDAQVVWLNERYFASMGVRIGDPAVRERISASFLHDFGVISTATASVSFEPGKQLELLADRYGGTGGSVHGGSGRAGSVGNYIAKGIGRTPLVSSESDWWHSTGLMWLSEAVREAILSEVCTIELPHGAVPTVAIIDTGIEVQRHAGARIERCGIAVRPFFVRPAHFERSIYFGDSGKPGTAQFLDAQRVQQVWDSANRPESFVGRIYPGLTEMLELHARQVGYARALRLWPGRFLTSNASIDGRVADFGAFRAVPNWRRQTGQPGECFGTEAAQFNAAALSLCFYKERQSGNEAWRGGLRDIYRSLDHSLDRAFEEAVDRSFGLFAIQDAMDRQLAGKAIRAFYELQQQRAGEEPFVAGASLSLESLSSTAGIVPSRLAADEREIAFEALKIINMHENAKLAFEYLWRDNRRYLSRTQLEESTIPFVDTLLGQRPAKSESFTAFIDNYLARTARLTRLIPEDFLVLDQAFSKGCWQVSALEARTGQTRQLIVGHEFDGRLDIDGTPRTPAELGIVRLSTCSASGLTSFLVPA